MNYILLRRKHAKQTLSNKKEIDSEHNIQNHYGENIGVIEYYMDGTKKLNTTKI